MKKYVHKKVSNTPSFTAGDATVIKEILHPKKENLTLPYSLAHGSLEGGKSSLPHTLQNDELYYILKGECIIYIDDNEVLVKANEVLLVKKNARQYVRNVKDEKLTFLCIVNPPWNEAQEEILTKF